MSDLTPSFIHNQSQSDPQQLPLYYIGDRTYKNPQKPTQQSDYIKILEYEDDHLESYGNFQDSTLAHSYNSPNELTFHPIQHQFQQTGGPQPLQERNMRALNNQQNHQGFGKGREANREENSSNGDGSIISGFLKETFSKDTNALKYLKEITGSSKENIENMNLNQIGNAALAANKQGTKPPKYQPPKTKPAEPKEPNKVVGKILHHIQEEKREKEEDEELRPLENIPKPMKVTEEPKKVTKNRENSIKRAKSPKQQEVSIVIEEDKSLRNLKRFYGNLIGENKKNKEKSLMETKRSVESELFGEEDLLQEYQSEKRLDSQISTKSSKSKRVTFSTEETVPEKPKGQIIRRSSKSIKEEEEIPDLFIFNKKDEKELLGKSVTWLNEKYKYREEVLKMEEQELNEASEVLKTEKDWKKKVEDYIIGLFGGLLEKDVRRFVDEDYDLEGNRMAIERLMRVKRSPAFYFIDFMQKFSHLGLIREMAENKSKIKKVNMGISKLRRENNKIQKLLKEENNTTSKKNTLKNNKKGSETGQLKRTSYQENETKILMMTDIKSRLLQKNVILALKWGYCSAKMRNDLLQTLRNAYNHKLLFQVLGSFCFNKQFKASKKTHQDLAKEHMRKVWMGQLMEGWTKIIRLRQQKMNLYRGLGEYSKDKLKKRGFYGILMLIQYKKVIKADVPLAEKFDEYRLQKKAFLSLKNAADFEQIFKEKKQSLKNFCAGKPIHDPREKPMREALVKDSMRMAKVILNRLMKLSSKRDYYYEPLLNIKSLLRPKFAEKKKLQSNNQMALPNLAQIKKQSKKRFGGLAQEDSHNVVADQQSFQALLYKKKRYIVDNLSHSSIFEELSEHISSLHNIRRTLEITPQDLPEPPKGVLNHQALEKFHREREEKRVKGSLFTKWKIAFLEKWTNIETDLYHTMYISKAMIQKVRNALRERKDLQESFGNQRKEKAMRKTFRVLKQGYVEKLQEENRVILQLRGGKLFAGWREYSMEKKAKRELYNKFSVFYAHNISRKICRKWKVIADKNKEIREKTQWLIKKTALKQWARKFNNRVLLGNVFGSFLNKANHYSEHVPKNNFQLLACIIKAWRNEVIENEHTAAQQVNILLAQNHRKQVMRVKVFRAWKEIPSRIKSLVMMTEIFKENFRKNIYRKWKYITQYTQCHIANFQQNQQRLSALRCFQALYRNGLQQKLVKCFLLRRFFLRWNASFHLRTEILPRRCYVNTVYRAFFNYLKEKRMQKIIGLKHKFLANKFYKRTEKSLLQKAFYRLFENRLLSLKKKTLYKRLALFHGKSLVRKSMDVWKMLKYRRFVKEKKKRIADAFKMHTQHLWLKAHPTQKTMSLQYQVMSLAFNGWRANALKSQNVKHIIGRFRRFKSRITMRGMFNHWYQRYRENRINNYQLPTFNINFSRYLKTDSEEMKKKYDTTISGRRKNETLETVSSWRTGNTDLNLGELATTERELWLEGHRKNEEFLKKLAELKEMDEMYRYKKY